MLPKTDTHFKKIKYQRLIYDCHWGLYKESNFGLIRDKSMLISWGKEENDITSFDAGREFDKIQHPLLIKKFSVK